MAHWRRIDTRIWLDAKFTSLSDDGKLVFTMLLTHPHMTKVGAMLASPAGLSGLLRWPPERLAEPFRELCSKRLVAVDPEASFVWLPKFVKYNPPANPNAVKSWGAALELVPECRGKFLLIQALEQFLEGYRESFRKAWRTVTATIPAGFAERYDEQGEGEGEGVRDGPDGPFSLFPAEPTSLTVAGEGARAGGGPELPGWAKKIDAPRGVTRRQVAGAVVAIVEAVTERPVNPQRCAGAARKVLALWRDLDRPDPNEFRSQAELVARAARESPDRLFAHDVRAEGWPEGTDRRHSVATLMVQERWGDRLAAAERWAARSQNINSAADPRGETRHGMRNPNKRGERWCSRAGTWVPEAEWKPLATPTADAK